MASVLADERDIRFVLFEQLKVQELFEKEKFSEFSVDVCEMILSEAHKFGENVLFPLHLKGDKEGARFEGGRVYSTPGTKEAYQSYAESGWLTPCEDEKFGGQGLPHVIMSATHEIFFAAGFPFMCYANLTHDAAKLIEIFGTEDQKNLYLEKMYGGQWTGTMDLTEPGAGTDIGAIKTTARPLGDGTYSITGSKIYITGGEHDVAENIVHMVLARIQGDPPGTKGLSVFIVPKYRINADGSIAEPNDIACVGIEEKMGLHASPTTSLSFGENNDCVGYLLGGAGEGTMVMFHMMNASRLEVGMWGQGTSSVSYLHALKYAREREQGQNIDDSNSLTQVPIVQHPDIRRTLLMMKAYVEGMRAMLYYCSYAMDRQAVAQEEEEKKRWGRIVDLLIPVCKAYPTEKGVEIASQAIQVYGGYGFSSEYPVEHFMRDSKVGCIFEGTTGIQAMDLALRKVAMNKGKVFLDFLESLDSVISAVRRLGGWEKYAAQLERTKSLLAEAPSVFAAHAADGQKYYPFLKATPFLEAFGDVVVAWFLLWSALVAQEKLEALFEERGANDARAREALIDENSEAAFFAGKVQSAKFFIGNILPITAGKIEAVKWGDVSAWEIRERSFGA